MKRRLMTGWLMVMATLTPAMSALADRLADREPLDARLEGYPVDVTLKEGPTAQYWMLMVAVAMVAMTAVFKTAKRSHLD